MTDDQLKRIEWMLSDRVVSSSEVEPVAYEQGYGDLTTLNRDGIILRSIGRERLEGFANDYLDLLGTSSAIYEANGDYAYGIFTSGWCRMMDHASRDLCDTPDNAAALGSGRWLCHESCWTDCSRRAIAENAPVDIACNGGIRMYAVPIVARGSVVGAINFGYGDPPKDPETLKKLAEAYRLDVDELVREAGAYESRPVFLIELAKRRLRGTARLIGSMIETKQVEEALRQSEETLRTTLHSIGDAVISTDIGGLVVSMNPVAESLTGWSRTNAIGQPLESIFRIVNEQTRLPVESPVTNVLRSGHIVGLANHTVLIARDGREIPIADSGAPIRNEAGVTTGVVLVFRDQTEERRARQELRRRLDYEKLLNEASTMALVARAPDEFRDRCLALVGEGLGVSRAYLFRHDDATDTMDNTHEWCAEGVDPQRDELQGVPGSAFAWWLEIMRRHEIICYSDVEEIPDETTKKLLRSQDIQSILVVPLFVGGRYYGFLGFDDCVRRREWHQEDVDILLSLSGIVALATERSQVQQQLQNERQQLLSIFDGIEEAIYIADPETYEVLFVNKFLRNLTNRELHGGKCYEQFQGLDAPCEFCTNHIIKQNPRDVYRWEFYNRNLNRYYLLFDRMISWPDGRDVRFEMAIDITERKQWEDKINLSTERLKEAEQIGKLGHVDWVVADQRSYWSDEVFRIYERDPESGVPGYDEIMALHSPDDAKRLEEAVVEALQHGKEYELDLAAVMPSGQEKYLHIIGRPIRDDEGHVTNIRGIVQDITKQKQAEEALRKSELQQNLILNNTQEMFAFYDLDLAIIWANRSAADSVGMSQEEIVGKRCYEVWQRRSDPCEGCPVVRARETKQIQSGEATTPDGKRWSLRGYPVLDDREEVVNLIELGMDVTARVQAEAEREHMQAQLIQAQKMESVGRLAGGVAHDFNNMLGVILGHADMALDQIDPGLPLHDDLQEIRKAAERSANLTRQLLTFARKQTIAPRVIDLNQTVEGMISMLRRLIGEDIDLAWLPGKHNASVKVDASQIDQILANLCVNARDAIDDVGNITIETDVVSFDAAYCAVHAGFLPGEYVLLAVSDNGCGMDTETVSHLFEPFFTTKEQGKGTGLGLASVYGAVKQNGGFINVYSEPGQGTTFKVYLPRHQEGSPCRADRAPAAPTGSRSETILLVEDEPAILRISTRMLEGLGYTVIAAGTPGEAIRLAHEHSGTIDLLMTDVVMPEMNGRDLARNLLSIYPGIRRLFMSGYTANVIAHHGVLDEGVHFIQKPFSSRDLAAKIREALNRD